MPDLIGKTLGPYRIVEQIGLGGMSTVYKAYQPSMDRYVALKVLSTYLTQDPSFVKRFQQEAKVIAKLEHLHILPVYDHGEEGSYLYLVMRFIEAGTLKDRLEDGPLSLGEARRVVNQIGSALEYAHQLGVVHRDLKPSNILIDPQGDCSLTDFGIAKMVESTLGLTGSAILGTPHYMAPEQSQSLKVDHRADIYAMGVIIYQMVTGQLPFDAETPVAVALKHISEPLPLPRSLKPDLPESVERVILKALAKDPTDRYQSMRDLVAGFDQAVQSAQPQASSVTAASLAPSPSPAIQEEAAEPTSAVHVAAPTPDTRRSAGIHPLWLVGAAGLALLVLVLAGLILSRIPGRVEISGGQVQVVLPTPTEEAVAVVGATPTETAQAEATAPTAPQATATPTYTTSPTPTAAPTDTPLPMPTPTPTRAPTNTPNPTPMPDAVVSARAAQQRAGPGTGYPVVGQAKRGDGLQVEGRNDDGGWLEVVMPDGTQGWVSGSLLELNLALDEVAVAAIPPTPTPSLADEAGAFAGPILDTIAGRPPDFEDDFATADKGWNASYGTHGNEGTFAIEDGVARFRLGQADMYMIHDALTRKDFVLQADARLADGDMASRMHAFFHNLTQDYWYSVDLASGLGSWRVGKMWEGRHKELATGVGNVGGLGETTQVTVVTRGSRAAVYLDGRPVAYFEDADFDTAGKTLLMCTSYSQAVCEFDNVKFWDLDNVPVPSSGDTTSVPQLTSLSVRAYIDGQSQLFIQGDSVRWHHEGATAPGRQFVNEPTFLNREVWYPTWPDVPDSLNTNCNCDSSAYVGIPALAMKDQTVDLEVIQARHTVSIVQQPNSTNDYTLIVKFDDGPPDGAEWYEVELSYVSG